MKFYKMDIGECFAPWGEKFDKVALPDDERETSIPIFEKVDATHARQMKTTDRGYEPMENAPLVEMEPTEDHPCTWEP